MARMDSLLEKMETTVDVFEESLNIMDTTDLEANRETLEAVTEQQDNPKKGHSGKYLSIGGPIWGLASSHWVPLAAEEMDPG
jgi:hypothetical protein